MPRAPRRHARVPDVLPQQKHLDQLEHVVVLAANDPVTPHFRAVRRRERHGDGIVMHVQAEEQRGTGCRRGPAQDAGSGGGRGRPGGRRIERAGAARFLRLDGGGVSEYVGLHGVWFSVIHGYLERKSHNLWLGFPFFGSRPMFTPESRHRFRFIQSHTD